MANFTVNSGTGADFAITVHDKMDDGLTLNPNSFKITINSENVGTSNYTIKVNSSAKKTAAISTTVISEALTDDDTFEIVFNENFVKDKTALPNNTDIVITYKAILNSSAKQYYDGTTTNDNASHLTYEEQTTVASKVKV